MNTADAPAPVFEEFNPLSQEFLTDPGPILDRARREAPVFFMPAFGFWVVTRYDDVMNVLTDSETFSQNAAALIPPPVDLAGRVSTDVLMKGFMNADPPYHTVVRKAVADAFARRRIGRMGPAIEEIVDGLVDRLIDRGRCELLKEFCYELTQRTVVEMLGLPAGEDDLPRYRQWTDDLVTVFTARPAPGQEVVQTVSDEELHLRWSRIAEASEFLAEVVKQRRAEPQEDLISALAELRDENGELSLTETQLLALTITLITAGTHATANMIAQMVRLLDQHPDQRAEAQRDPDVLRNAIEETLRFRSPGIGLFRWTTRDVEISGVTVRKDSLVMMLFCSAGLDGDHFGCPHEFDIHRDNAKTHLTFGRGRHFCLGAPLARLEAEVALRTLYRRMPDLRLVPDQKLEYEPSMIAFLLKGLEVEWTPPG
jgi:cytochrome P450